MARYQHAYRTFKLAPSRIAGEWLEGTLPDELFALRKLQVLDMSENKLNGTLPEALYSLHMLRVLNLHNNENALNLQIGILIALCA